MLASKGVPSFGRMSADLPSSARERLAVVARQVHFRPGQRIVSCLHSPRTLYVIQEGLAKMVGISEDGRERILHLFRPGELTGWVALEKDHEAGCDVIAVSPVQALAIDRRDFLEVGRGEPTVLLAVTLVEASRLGAWLSRGLLFVLAPVASAFVHLLLSSKRELRADETAAAVVDSPQDLADALVRLDAASGLVQFAASPATEPLYTVNPFEEEGLVRMFLTHPPLERRVARLRALPERP